MFKQNISGTKETVYYNVGGDGCLGNYNLLLKIFGNIGFVERFNHNIWT